MDHHHPKSDPDAISRLHDCVESLEHDIKHLRRENDKLRQTAKASVSRAEDLQIQLSEDSIQLAQLQGSTGGITDVQVRTDIESLANAIRDLATTFGRQVLKKHDFQSVYARNLDDDLGHMVEQILNVPSSLVTADTEEWFEECLLWLGDISTCPYIVLSRVIWRLLAESVFSLRFPIGLPAEDKDLILKLTPFMDPSHSNREWSSASTRNWRSKTLHAMSKTDAFKAQRKRDLLRLWDGFLNALRDWFPDSISKNDIEDLREHLRDDIFRPAADLQQALALSAYEYDVKSPEPLILPGTLTSDTRRLSNWSLVNIMTWISADGAQDLKGVLLVLSPGLVRRRLEKSGKDVTMLKPTVIVFDDEAPDLPSLPGAIALLPFLDKSRISRTPDRVDSDSPPPSTTPRGRSSPKKMKESDLFNVSEDERLDREPEPPSGSSTRAPSGGSRHRRRARDTRPSRPPETLSQGKSSSSYERSSPDLKKKAKESS